MRPTLRQRTKRVAWLVTPFGEDAISTSDASGVAMNGFTEISVGGNRVTFVNMTAPYGPRSLKGYPPRKILSSP